ncbi:MAG: energy-coupling factor transporter transmembrane component T family protein [Syntrophales bacterium]
MINLGQYKPDDTILHRLDPRVKICAVMALSILIFAATATGIVLITLFLTALIRTARLSLAETAAALRPVALFMAVIFLMHLLTTGGEPLFAFPGLPIAATHEGFAKGAYVTWQFAGLVIGGALLTLTTSPSELMGGIERLLRPFSRVGIPSQEIAVMIAMALRFMPMLLEEYDRLRVAQMARGADFSTGGITIRMRALRLLVVPLLLAAFRRADELTTAMEARGYRRGPRTMLRELSMGKADLAACTLMAVFILLNLGMRAIP